MSKHGQKEIFTAIGHVVLFEGRHRFIPNSPKYLSDQLSHVPLKTQVSCTFSKHVATRSNSQLAYHWVLMKYIADHCGYTPEECHDAIMRLRFGTKTIQIAGKKVEIRKSVSDKALFPKYDMVELITYDLELCSEMEIVVPTKEELGYL